MPYKNHLIFINRPLYTDLHVWWSILNSDFDFTVEVHRSQISSTLMETVTVSIKQECSKKQVLPAVAGRHKVGVGQTSGGNNRQVISICHPSYSQATQLRIVIVLPVYKSIYHIRSLNQVKFLGNTELCVENIHFLYAILSFEKNIARLVK